MPVVVRFKYSGQPARWDRFQCAKIVLSARRAFFDKLVKSRKIQLTCDYSTVIIHYNFISDCHILKRGLSSYKRCSHKFYDMNVFLHQNMKVASDICTECLPKALPAFQAPAQRRTGYLKVVLTRLENALSASIAARLDPHHRFRSVPVQLSRSC